MRAGTSSHCEALRLVLCPLPGASGCPDHGSYRLDPGRDSYRPGPDSCDAIPSILSAAHASAFRSRGNPRASRKDTCDRRGLRFHPIRGSRCVSHRKREVSSLPCPPFPAFQRVLLRPCRFAESLENLLCDNGID